MSDPVQADILGNPTSRRYFEPFVAQSCTATLAAEEVGCTLNAMLYRIRTFMKAGLLRIAHVEKRHGRAIKHYRSAYDAYLVPFQLTSYAGLEERMIAQMAPLWREIAEGMAMALREKGMEGQRIFRHESGAVWALSGDPAPSQARMYAGRLGTSKSAYLHLDDENARDLQAALDRLFETYLHKQSQQGKRYIIDLSLVPARKA